MTNKVDSNDLAAMMLEDAQPSAPAPDKLAVIIDTAHRLQAKQREMVRVGEILGKLATEAEDLEFNILPGLMDEASLKDFTLDDGTTIERTEEVYASISKDNAPTACAWLDKHGYGDIVKSGFIVVVPKGPNASKIATSIRILLTKAKLVFEHSVTVHPQTLKAFVKESIKQSRKLPVTISVHQKPRALLKEPKAVKR